MLTPKYKKGDDIYFVYQLPEGVSRVDERTGEVLTTTEEFAATILSVATTIPPIIDFDPEIPYIAGFHKIGWTYLYAIELDWNEIEQINTYWPVSPNPQYGRLPTDVVFENQITNGRIGF